MNERYASVYSDKLALSWGMHQTSGSVFVSIEAFQGDCVVTAADDQVSCEMEGGQVILNLENGVYYELDGVGARIWELLQEPRKVDVLRDVVMDEYDVELGQCERDLKDLLADLASHGLIRIDNATSA